MNPLVILSGGKDALLARETFVTDLYIVAYRLERKTKLLEGPGNLIKTFRPFGLRQLKVF